MRRCLFDQRSAEAALPRRLDWRQDAAVTRLGDDQRRYGPGVSDGLAIKEPPTNLWESMSYLGPSMILSASIVGSGELIMTTTLGAKAGFVALWVIIASCLVKVCVQFEFGKHAICSGETTMQSLNVLPGPIAVRVRWSIWMWLLVQVVIFFQYGGIVEGVGQALNIGLPQLPVWFWAAAAGLTTAVLLSVGRYRLIQNLSIFLMALVHAVYLRVPRAAAEHALSDFRRAVNGRSSLAASQRSIRRGGGRVRPDGRRSFGDHFLSVLVPGERIRGLYRPQAAIG